MAELTLSTIDAGIAPRSIPVHIETVDLNGTSVLAWTDDHEVVRSIDTVTGVDGTLEIDLTPSADLLCDGRTSTSDPVAVFYDITVGGFTIRIEKASSEERWVDADRPVPGPAPEHALRTTDLADWSNDDPQPGDVPIWDAEEGEWAPGPQTGTDEPVSATDVAYTPPGGGPTTGYEDVQGAVAALDAYARNDHDLINTNAIERVIADEALAADLETEAASRAAGDALMIPLAQRGASSGVATLDGGGKVPAGQLPSIAISDFLGDVASQAAMLALVGQRGDWCTRSDTNTSWILAGDDASVLANWKMLRTPTDLVSSVDGQTGAVSLSGVYDPAGAASSVATALTGEAATRAAADTALSTALTTEVTDRGTAVAGEAAARAAADALLIPLTQKGANSGVASLDSGGKVPSAQLPSIAISDWLGAVASQAAMLALTGQRGDWATRTDTNTTWMLIADDATQLASWKMLLTPADAVSSVDGQTGAVSLAATYATLAGLAAEAALARDGSNITTGTVPDARIAPTIARDSEVAAAVAPAQATADAASVALGIDEFGPMLSVLAAGKRDVHVLVMGDSTAAGNPAAGDSVTMWPGAVAAWLGTQFPAYTVKIAKVSTSAPYQAFAAAATLQTGTGSFTLTFWNAAISGTRSDTMTGAGRFAGLLNAHTVDLILFGHSHNEGAIDLTPEFGGTFAISGNTNNSTKQSGEQMIARCVSVIEQVRNYQPQAPVVIIGTNPELGGTADAQDLRLGQLARMAALMGYGFIATAPALRADARWNSVLASNVLMSDNLHPTAAGQTVMATAIISRIKATTNALSASVRPSIFERPSPTQLLANPQLTQTVSGTIDSPWTTTAVTVTKELTIVEGTKGYSARLDASSAAASSIQESVTTAILPYVGKYVTAAARVYVPTNGSGGAAQNMTSVGVLRVYCNPNYLTYTLLLSTWRPLDGWHWLVMPVFIPTGTTSVEVRVFSGLTAADSAARIYVDRLSLVPGIWPGEP